MVRLVPMNESDFHTYLTSSIADYAQEHVKAGNWSAEEAQQKAEEEFQQLVPDGLASKNQYFFTIEDETLPAKVGILWFAVRDQGGQPSAFVYDVEIFAEFRRRGYGMQAFQALESYVRNLGLTTISLHVFGHNHAARAMYEKLGYITTNVSMSKTLDNKV